MPLPLRIELMAYLCYLATEDDDLEAAVAAGERGLSLAATSNTPWETAMLQLALAFAYDCAGPQQRALDLATEARRGFEHLGDRWGAASSAVTGALGALGLGDTDTAAALTADAVRLNADYDVGAIPAALLEASLAERRGDSETAVGAYSRALDRSRRASFAEHASFALTGLGSVAFANGNLDQAEAHCRRALVVAEAASASWLVAHTKASLAQVLEAAGDSEAAESLYSAVVAWSGARPHTAREALFVLLGGSPGTRALLGLAELAEASGDSARGRRVARSRRARRLSRTFGQQRRAWQSRPHGWQPAGSAVRDGCGVESMKGSVMPTTTFGERLAEIGHQIDGLEAKARAGGGGAKSRIQRQLGVLRQQEASVRAAAHEGAEAFDEKFEQFEARFRVARASLAAGTLPKTTRSSRTPSRTSSTAGIPTSSGCRRRRRCAQRARGSSPRRRSAS